MRPSKPVPMEDTVKALLDYLVDPALPSNSTAHASPSISQQELVAKQVHAALLLYNYYHRKEHPRMKYLGFEAFCKLAVVLKPTLIAHMKLMQLSNNTDLDELGEGLSLTEKAIRDACDLSLSLDASIDVPHTEGWPVSKVSVFLVDAKKENCFLLFGSVTQGVWSVIEKDINISNQSSEGMVEAKYVDRKKRILRKAPRDESYIDEAGIQEFAYSAVEKTTGIDKSDIWVLESHVVYSLSKEKTVARFYIMQSSQSTNKEVIQVPVKDVINSLRGPLVERGSYGWTLTPVIEYFHLLPYAGILSTWFSREVLPESLETVIVEPGNVNVGISKRTEGPCFADDRNGDECYRDYLNADISGKTEEPCGTDDGIGNESSKDSVNVDIAKRTEETCDTIDRTGEESHIDVDIVVGTDADDRIGDECYGDYLKADISEKTEEHCVTDDGIGNESSKKSVSVDIAKRTEETCDTIDRTGEESHIDVGIVVKTEADDRIEDECYGDYLNVDISEKTEEPCGKDDGIGNESSKEFVNVNIAKRTEETCDTITRTGEESHMDVGIVVGTDANWITAESPKQHDGNGCLMPGTTALGDHHSMDEDEIAISCHGNDGKRSCSFQVDHLHEHATLPTESCLKSLGSDSIEVDMVDSVRPDASDCIYKELIDGNKLCNMTSGKSNIICHVNLQSNVPTKDKLSEIALRVLHRKKDRLCHQQRVIEEEIAQCNEVIQTILAGNGDDIALKIESILEDYDAGFLSASQNQNSTYESSDGSLVHLKRKRLAEVMENPCQELDSICYENNWILPTYRVSPKHGGFKAHLMLKVMDLECSVHSNLHANPHEARKDAAAQMVVKLGNASDPVTQ